MKKTIFSLLIFTLALIHPVWAQFDEDQVLTQEQFAVELIRIMEFEHLLPPVALPSDCVAVLESYGIAPLGGWNHKEPLTKEDYYVIVGKAQGREDVVHKRAVDIEKKHRDIINRAWQESYEKEGRWLPLEDLLKQEKYFPNGVPRSPYGVAYKDKDGDHKVDPLFLPNIELIDLLKTLSRNY